MIRVGLEAGLPLTKLFHQQATRGPQPVRALAARVADRLEDGDSLSDALTPESGRLPPLFVALSAVGEETGRLGESFRELEHYFETQHTLRKNFISQIAWPVFQLIAAIGVICLMLLIMGMLGIQMDPLGLGTGPSAVLKFLTIVGCVGGLLFLAYWIISRRVRFLAPAERLILATPILGPTLEAVLLGRFSLGLRMTFGAGLNVDRAVKQSLDAAASALYLQSYQKAKPGLRRGADLTTVLQECQVFPRDFLDVVANAEESGQIPEVMERQSRHFREEAGRRLKALAQVAAWGVYAAVACLIIYLIFRLYSVYLGNINAAM